MCERARDDEKSPSGQKIDFFRPLVHILQVDSCYLEAVHQIMGQPVKVQTAGPPFSPPRS